MSSKSTDMDPKVLAKLQGNLKESAKRSEMPWHAFGQLNDEVIESVPERTALSTIGSKINVKLNMWKLDMDLSKDILIYQYDVQVKNEQDRKTIELRKMKRRAWEGPTVQGELENEGRFLYDGNSIAFGLKKISDLRLHLDLSIEEGRQASKADSKNRVLFEMAYTRTLSTKNLKDMLQGTNTGANALNWGEILNCLEHVLHQYPSRNMVVKNKQFYLTNAAAVQQWGQGKCEDRQAISEGLIAVRGIYVSFKPVFLGYENGKTLRQLALNVDVSNSAFWLPGKIIDNLGLYFNPGYGIGQVTDDIARAKSSGKTDDERQSAFYRQTRFGRFALKLRRVRCTHLHLPIVKDKDGKVIPPMEKGITNVIPKTPTEVFFGEEINGKKLMKSVAQYFQEKYKFKCAAWPVVQFGSGERAIYVPLEVCRIAADQKYNYKLNEKQTSDMLNFAVKLPLERWANIQEGVRTMKWAEDPWIKAYGMKVAPVEQPIEVKDARLLPTPTIHFAGSNHPPRTTVTGRWRIDGKKFASPNELKIGAFGFAIHRRSGRSGRFDASRDDVLRFAKDFARIYASHGGLFVNAAAAQNPFIWEGDCSKQDTLKQFGQGIMQHCKATAAERAKPVLCFFVVPDRDADVYTAIKNVCDIRWGSASQVMQSKHVQKSQGQYISNICMKVNAKLGGATSIATGHPAAAKMILGPTAIIGADVTHGGPGVEVDSIAAMTMSRDSKFTKYMGVVAANGTRQEIIQTGPIEEMVTRMIRIWATAFKRFPEHIIYMRDGVSNQQFYKIITEEVRDMKKAMQKYLTSIGKQEQFKVPKFTVLCATKRHHTRLFPLQHADTNKNPLPGTLVETGCTLATGVDFFLNSHVAIKGTARPVHYVVLQNESNYKIETLQQFVLEHCFQYCRSTTPVSQHPAIYYSHLAAARGIQHLKLDVSRSSAGRSQDVNLLKIHPLDVLNEQLTPYMWFV